MTSLFRPAFLAAALASMPLGVALAQNPGPAYAPEAGSGKMATPNYPAGGKDVDPALTGVRPTPEMGRAPPSGNPNVAGATGETVIPGNNSTIRGDKGGTVEDKVNQTSPSGG